MTRWLRLLTEPMPDDPTWAQGTVAVLSALGVLFGAMALGGWLTR